MSTPHDEAQRELGVGGETLDQHSNAVAKINARRGRIVRWPQANIFALCADLTVAVAGGAQPHYLSSVDIDGAPGPKMVHLPSSPGAWVTRAKA
jgi:hypothetical protein